MVKQNQLAENRKIAANFLDLRKIPEEYRLPKYSLNPIPYGYIYCIENKINGRKYIGSTCSVYSGVGQASEYHQLRKRVSHYIYEYNKLKSASTSIKWIDRPIIRAMVDHGIENFVMYPIAETSENNHAEAETYFISKFQTFLPAFGYNVRKLALTGGTGRTLTDREKALRSEKVIGINLNTKQIIFAASMKLLADYLNTSKDIIKNNNRSGRTHKGWYIFYLDANKRNYILQHYVLKDNLGIQKRGNPRYHSKESKKFYYELVNKVSTYLEDFNHELFSDFTVLSPLEYNIDNRK